MRGGYVPERARRMTRAVLTFHSVDDSGSVLSFPPAAFRALGRATRGLGRAGRRIRRAHGTRPRRHDHLRRRHAFACTSMRCRCCATTAFRRTCSSPPATSARTSAGTSRGATSRFAMLDWPRRGVRRRRHSRRMPHGHASGPHHAVACRASSTNARRPTMRSSAGSDAARRCSPFRSAGSMRLCSGRSRRAIADASRRGSAISPARTTCRACPGSIRTTCSVPRSTSTC